MRKALSPSSLHVANALGLLDLLTDYIHLSNDYREKPSIEHRMEIIELSQKIHSRVNQASLEIAAVASEMDCEEERADQIASYLKEQEDEAETRLTVGALVVGALGAIVSGVLLANGNESNAPDFVGIGAGLAEVTLGVMILTNKKTVLFYHPRNALKDIWTAPETSSIFPPAVWFYLNYKNPESPEKPLREQLVEQWLSFGQVADAHNKNKEKLYALLFGEGGRYTAEQLANRANMHDQVESQVNLMQQALRQLGSDIERLFQR